MPALRRLPRTLGFLVNDAWESTVIPRVIKTTVTFQTPNLNNGVTIYVPNIGDLILDSWVNVTTLFNTLALLDWGTFSGAGGVLNNTPGASPKQMNVSSLTGVNSNAGLSHDTNSDSSTLGAAAITDGVQSVQGNQWLVTCTAASPILLVVSQNGLKGGPAIASTAGSADFYLHVASTIRS